MAQGLALIAARKSPTTVLAFPIKVMAPSLGGGLQPREHSYGTRATYPYLGMLALGLYYRCIPTRPGLCIEYVAASLSLENTKTNII